MAAGWIQRVVAPGFRVHHDGLLVDRLLDDRRAVGPETLAAHCAPRIVSQAEGGHPRNSGPPPQRAPTPRCHAESAPSGPIAQGSPSPLARGTRSGPGAAGAPPRPRALTARTGRPAL